MAVVMKTLLRVSVCIVPLAFATAPAGASVIADLSADWSDIKQP
jgi:hypothetical protein